MKWAIRAVGPYKHAMDEVKRVSPGYVAQAVETALNHYAINGVLDVEVSGQINMSGHGSLILKIKADPA
jgi:hypothetical protein